MRFALAFVAILVVSWTYGGEAVETGAKKSVKDIANAYENPQDGASSSGAKTVTVAGAQKSVKELVNIYESYTKKIEKTPESQKLPTPAQVEQGLQNGQEMEIADLICLALADFEADVKHWWDFLCGLN